MRQAITTKVLPATNHKGTRIKAVASAGSLIVSWNHAENQEINHLMAARALQRRFQWPGSLIGGWMPDSSSFQCCFVLEDK